MKYYTQQHKHRDDEITLSKLAPPGHKWLVTLDNDVTRDCAVIRISDRLNHCLRISTAAEHSNAVTHGLAEFV